MTLTPADARTILAYIDCIDAEIDVAPSPERDARINRASDQAADALRALQAVSELPDVAPPAACPPSKPDRGAPYRCPVCEGRGRIGLMGVDRCPTCKGDRVLWSRA